MGEHSGADRALALTGQASVPCLGASRFDHGEVIISRELYAFLMGEGPLEGVWFGELNEGLRGAFWWRAFLRCAAGWPETAPQEDAPIEGTTP